MFEGFYVKVVHTHPYTQEELLSKEQLIRIREIMLNFVYPEEVFLDTVINQSFLNSGEPLQTHYIEEDVAGEIAFKIDEYLLSIGMYGKVQVENDWIRIWW
jgi:hypothetical protein